MRNIYIETDENFRVTKIHRMPFDPNNGMGYTKEELEKKGFFVDEIPAPVHQTGRRSIAMYNPDTKSIYYEYVGTPTSDKERIDYLESAMNFIMRNSIYGMAPAIALAEETEPSTKLSVYDEGAANYLASQIIVSKLDLDECLRMFPQLANRIKEILSDNGIQV